jgi:DNA-directed RNA polymerase specialized sigma subunit
MTHGRLSCEQFPDVPVEAELRLVQAEIKEMREKLPLLVRRRNELMALALGAGLTQARLADVLDISAGRVAQIISALNDSGLFG